MTREERDDAIRFFEQVAKDEVGHYSRLAIEALKSKIDLDLPISPLLKESKAHSATDTNVGDMVYRQAAIDALRDEFKRTPTTAIRAMDVIGRLPSAQQERKRGHKINQHQYPAKWVCSECGARHFDFSDNFCSKCGADVRGEQYESD